MKKWIVTLGVLVGLIVLLLIQSDGRKMLHTEMTPLPGPPMERLENQSRRSPHTSLAPNTHSRIVQIFKRRTE